jgi:hypothetical protein
VRTIVISCLGAVWLTAAALASAAAASGSSSAERCAPLKGATFDFSGTIAPRGAGNGIRKFRGGVTVLDVRPVGCPTDSDRYEVTVKTSIPDACVPNARVRGSGNITGEATEPVFVRVHRIEAESIAC